MTGRCAAAVTAAGLRGSWLSRARCWVRLGWALGPSRSDWTIQVWLKTGSRGAAERFAGAVAAPGNPEVSSLPEPERPTTARFRARPPAQVTAGHDVADGRRPDPGAGQQRP